MGGRGRGKGRKFNDSNNEDHGSCEEEKIPVQKPLKDDIDYGVADKIMEEEDANSGLVNKESGKKRKKKEKTDLLEEEVVTEEKSSIEDSTKGSKASGRAHNGSRRKGKPCRAAEACVECS